MVYTNLTSLLRHCDSGYLTFLICHEIPGNTSLKGFLALLLKILILGLHHVILGGHSSSAGGDITHLICHVIPKDHLLEGSPNFLKGSSSLYVTTLPSLVTKGIVVKSNMTSLMKPQRKSQTCHLWCL